MSEDIADHIMQMAARISVLRDELKVTNGQYLGMLIEVLKACFEMGVKHGKDK